MSETKGIQDLAKCTEDRIKRRQQDLTKAASELQYMESKLYQENVANIVAIGEVLSKLHKGSRKKGKNSEWGAEYRNLGLKASIRTADRWRHIADVFHDCPDIWGCFTFTGMAILAEFAKAHPLCLNHLKRFAEDWDNEVAKGKSKNTQIAKEDANEYCKIMERVEKKEKLLIYGDYPALKYLAETGNDYQIDAAEAECWNIWNEDTEGRPFERFGVADAKKVIEDNPPATTKAPPAAPETPATTVTGTAKPDAGDPANDTDEADDENDIDQDSEAESGTEASDFVPQEPTEEPLVLEATNGSATYKGALTDDDFEQFIAEIRELFAIELAEAVGATTEPALAAA